MFVTSTPSGGRTRSPWRSPRAGLALLAGLGIAAALLASPQAVQAQVNEFRPLLKAKRFAEVEKLADSKLAANPNDTVALIAKSSAIVASGQKSRFDEAATLAERCVEISPKFSNCHEALGNALGSKAMANGILSAMGYATKIRDSFKAAVDLDPSNNSARFSLLQYYSAAPSIIGGGKARAQQFAAETTAAYPNVGRLLSAGLELSDKQTAKAEALALGASHGGADDLIEIQRNVLVGVGSQYVGDKKFADADRVFKELQMRFPSSEWGVYGLARVAQEQGDCARAVGLFDQALSMTNGANIHYRKAQCLQTLGDKPGAIAGFQKALNLKAGLSKGQTADAQEQLKALKSV